MTFNTGWPFVCVYLNEKLEESSHLLDLALEFLSDGVEQAGGGFNAGQPLHGNKHCTLYGCGGLDQLILGHRVTYKHCRRNIHNNSLVRLHSKSGKDRKKKEGNPGPFRRVHKLVGQLKKNNNNFIETE